MEPTSKQPGPLVALAQTLEQFPQFLAGWVISTFISLISDPLVFCLAIGAVAFGFAVGLIPGIAMFFLLYPTLRMVATVAQSISQSGQMVSQSLVHTANVQLQQSAPPAHVHPVPEGEPTEVLPN